MKPFYGNSILRKVILFNGITNIDIIAKHSKIYSIKNHEFLLEILCKISTKLTQVFCKKYNQNGVSYNLVNLVGLRSAFFIPSLEKDGTK